MTSLMVYNRGKWILRIISLGIFICISYFAYNVPLPVLPTHQLKEKTPFFQSRQNVRKQLINYTNLGTYLTTIKSPFTLMYYDADGLTEILHDVRGSSLEDKKETRFFETNKATFNYASFQLTAPHMHFIFEKGIHTIPDSPYYEGDGNNVQFEFINGTPQITAETIEGSGEIPFFFGEKNHAARS